MPSPSFALAATRRPSTADRSLSAPSSWRCRGTDRCRSASASVGDAQAVPTPARQALGTQSADVAHAGSPMPSSSPAAGRTGPCRTAMWHGSQTSRPVSTSWPQTAHVAGSAPGASPIGFVQSSRARGGAASTALTASTGLTGPSVVAVDAVVVVVALSPDLRRLGCDDWTVPPGSDQYVWRGKPLDS